MDREKINEAAKQDAINTVIGDFYERGNYEMGFVSGAEWLMGQPIVERLTEDELKRIKEKYDYYMSEEPNCYLGSRMRNEYELIFGKEMFSKT